GLASWYFSHFPLIRTSVSSDKQPYTQPNVSRISNPARRILSPIKSCVRAPANTAMCPPGFNTRMHSSHTAGGGTNESQSLPMKPPRLAGTDTVSPVTHALSTSATCCGLVFDRPYGGSQTTASTELSSSFFNSSRQ